MSFLLVSLKIIIIIAFLLLPTIPFLAEIGRFKKDIKKGISYKRFRLAVFAVIYVIGITVAIYLLKDIIFRLSSLSFVQWIANNFAVSNRTQYCANVLVAIIINALIGFLYVFLSKLVRIGLQKKDLKNPKKSGEYTFFQKAERAIIKFFNSQVWFFVGRLFKWLFATLSALYILIFAFYQLPIFFGASWIPYGIILSLFSAGYIYPVITLMALCQISFFLMGIEAASDECEEITENTNVNLTIAQQDLDKIDKKMKEIYRDHYIKDVDLSKALVEQLSTTKHDEKTEYIAMAVEADKINPQGRKEVYMNCLDRIIKSDKSIVVSGLFHSEFSMYFLRYLSIIFARGDNVVFVCNTDSEIDETYNYIYKALCEMSSLYYAKSDKRFENPIWKIVKVYSDASGLSSSDAKNASILVTSLTYLCSNDFASEHKHFIHLLDTVVFVDVLTTVNTYPGLLSILNTHFKQIFENNALLAKNGNVNKGYKVRYMAKPIRYIGFDSASTSEVNEVLKNLLGVEFESADCRYYNPLTRVRLFDVEARPDEKGERKTPTPADIDEDLGVLVNAAIWALVSGAKDATVFANKNVPFENYRETIESHKGRIVSLSADSLKINSYKYNPDGYSVIIALDTEDNLPLAIRKYVSLASGSPAVVMLFIRKHILSEYYIDNINDIWASEAYERIPAKRGTAEEVARHIAVMANSGGISTNEILNKVSSVLYFKEEYMAKDISGILKKVLRIYGVSNESAESLYKHFDYNTTRDFDENGRFCSECRVCLNPKGELYNKVNGNDYAVLQVENGLYYLPFPADRITQRYIEGQNLIFDGTLYRINKINTESGIIQATYVTGGKNDAPFEYYQLREYRVEADDTKLNQIYLTKHIELKSEDGNSKIDDVLIKVIEAPAEVITYKYYNVDPHVMSWGGSGKPEKMEDSLVKQTYRRYGDFSTPTFNPEEIFKKAQLVSSTNGLLMMNIKIPGELGLTSSKAANLAAVMLEDILKLKFPSVADAIAVCAVTKNSEEDDDTRAVFDRHSRLTVVGEGEAFKGEGFEFVIIEDSLSEVGVISAIMTSGNDILSTIFEPLLKYLEWYMNASEKGTFLNCGLDHIPSCFDFEGLYKICKIIGDDKHNEEYIDVNTVIEYNVCSFCGKRFPKSEQMARLDDSRLICTDCANSLVENKKQLKSYFDSAKRFLESVYGITLDDSYEVSFESTAKVIAALKKNKDIFLRGTDIPTKAYIDDKRRVHIETPIPSANLSEILVRELTYAWQIKHVPSAPEDVAEGHIALVGIQYLRFLGYREFADVRTRYYESNNSISGKGYRRLVSELANNPKYKNNPFLYILQATGGEGGGEITITPTKPIVVEGEFGLPYVLDPVDRALDGNIKYFYRSNITATWQAAYDVIFNAISNHQGSAIIEGCSLGEIDKIIYAVMYDHPELFWYNSYSPNGNEIVFSYGATAEESELIQRKIDEAVPKYLEGINDSMSAYDVAVRLHVRLISTVDYDGIALREEKQRGGPKNGEIDYLRTIPGVFLKGTAVCEGYARAIQYLLQKCGVECAEVAGDIIKADGSLGNGHAWNILKIDGDYYYLDTTWDDSSNTLQEVKNSDFGFDYFCVTSEEMSRTRNNSMCPIEMPNATATKANYFYHNGLVLDTYDIEKIKIIAQTAAQSGQRWFAFKCKSNETYQTALNKLCMDREDCFDILKAASKQNKQIDDNGYSYMYDPNIMTVTIAFKFK